MDIIDRIIDQFLENFAPPVKPEDLEAFKRKLRQEEGGQKHYAYSVAAMDHAQLRRVIFTHLQAGLNTAQIAERVGRTQRAVQIIIARNPLA
jgi:hypothetical protein